MKRSVMLVFSVGFLGILPGSLISQQFWNSPSFLITAPIQRDGFKDESVSPNEFVRHFYGLIFALNTYDSRKDEDKLIFTYFSEGFSKRYSKMKSHDDGIGSSKNQVGCLNFNIFMNTQEVPYGFYVGQPKKTGNYVQVPVTFYYSHPHESNPTQNSVIVSLVPWGQSWKIQDLIYPSPERSVFSDIDRCFQMMGER